MSRNWRNVLLLELCSARLLALLRLFIVLLRLSKFSLAGQRLPRGNDKLAILHSIDRASQFVRLYRLLNWIGISSSRYHEWKNAQECGLDDVSSCPKFSPGQMTATERSEMRPCSNRESTDISVRDRSCDLLQGWERYSRVRRLGTERFVPETGLVIANGSTPPKPHVGLRATRPNE
jgi:hypothetical protein